MSGMADEMARRFAADGGDPSGGAVPGNEGGSPPAPEAPPAGASNTDTGSGAGGPDTIPYARFKEVNDSYQRLRPYEELETYGYDADSLRRLAAFEAGYLQDPVGTWRQMADNLDLPQEIRDAIGQHLADGAAAGDGRAQGDPPANDPSAAPLPPEVQSRLDYVDQLRAREENQTREAQLQAVVEAWNQLDKADEVETPERLKLMAIAQTAQAGGSWRTFEELAKEARDSVLEYRNSVLGSAVRTDRGGTPPPALPGSAPLGSGPVRFGNIREATKAAEADIAAGRLPTLQQ